MTHECHFWNLQPCSWYFGYCIYLTKCFFHNKWGETWLLLIKLLYELTDELANDLRKSQNFMKLLSSVQSSAQNENIVNTSKKLRKTRYCKLCLLHCKSCLVSICNAKLGWNRLKESIITADFKFEYAKMFLRTSCYQDPKFKRKFEAILETAFWEKVSCTPSL